MATYTQPLGASFGRTYANLLSLVRYWVVDAGGTTRIAATNTGITEVADADGGASLSGQYEVSATFDDTWVFPIKVKWGIVGYPGLVIPDIIQSPPAAINASGQGKLQAGTGAGQLDFTNGVLKGNVTQWNGTNVATPDTAGHPKVTIKDGTGTGEIALTNGAIDQVLQTIEAGNVLTLETLADGILTPSKFADGAITAAKIATGAIDADALASDAVVEIANGLLDLTDGIETGETLRQFLRIIRAVLAGVSDATDPDAGTVVFKRKDGTTALTVIYNAQGDRTNVTIGSV